MITHRRTSLKQALKAGTALSLPLILGLTVAGQALALDAGALPTGGTVVAGQASIASGPGHLEVTQTSKRTAIDWRSFDIGSQASVNFAQPGRDAIALNRVNGSANASQIEGRLTADGTVLLLNPNGVIFGPNSHVDVGGLVASTGKIDTARFMAGDTSLGITGATVGEIVVQGHITARDGGLAAFVAPSVRNSGVIVANLGKVALAAGETATLDLYGDHLIELGFGASNPLVLNSGQIDAAGGHVQLSAKAASTLVDNIVNNSGVISAASVDNVGGTIVLRADGGAAKISGSLDASGAKGGGFVETSGDTVDFDGLKVNTGGGKWLIDPTDLVIDSGEASAIVTGLAGGNVIEAATNSITVNAAVDSSGQSNSNTLSLNDQDGGGLTVNLNAGITLGASQHLNGQATLVNVANTGLIQNGVDASASGATVNVAAGTYNQALDISKNLSLVGAGSGSTIIQPTALLTTGANHKYDTNVKTAVYVHDASDVNISGLGIDANNLGANAAVFWNNASGSIKASSIELKPVPLSGVQTGQDLAVDASGSQSSVLTVDQVAFSNWDKNGIDAVNGNGSTSGGGHIDLTVTNSTFTGSGPTGVTAQNGVLLWNRGGGSVGGAITNNTFGNTDYTGADSSVNIYLRRRERCERSRQHRYRSWQRRYVIRGVRRRQQRRDRHRQPVQ